MQVEGEVEGGDGDFLDFLPWFDPGFFGNADRFDASTSNDEVVARLWRKVVSLCSSNEGETIPGRKEKETRQARKSAREVHSLQERISKKNPKHKHPEKYSASQIKQKKPQQHLPQQY